MARPKDYSKFNNDQLKDIYENLNHWQWDERLGKKPFMFDWLSNYKKPDNAKQRLRMLFCAIWPFTKADYITPVMRKIKDLMKAEKFLKHTH